MSFANKRGCSRTSRPAIQRISTCSNPPSNPATSPGRSMCNRVGSFSGGRPNRKRNRVFNRQQFGTDPTSKYRHHPTHTHASKHSATNSDPETPMTDHIPARQRTNTPAQNQNPHPRPADPLPEQQQPLRPAKDEVVPTPLVMMPQVSVL